VAETKIKGPTVTTGDVTEPVKTHGSTKERKPFHNSAGEKHLYPSEIEGLALQHNLTIPEAERVANGEKPDAVKKERVFFVQAFDKVPASEVTHSLVAADNEDYTPVGAAEELVLQRIAAAKGGKGTKQNVTAGAMNANPSQTSIAPSDGGSGPTGIAGTTSATGKVEVIK